MNEAALERPAVRLRFRWLVVVALALAAVAFVGGRYIFKRHGGYRPLALMHVPQTMRYRARIEINDVKRGPAIASLLAALDPSGARRAAFEQKLGVPLGSVAREVAFGAGANSSDFVLVLGLQLQAEAGLHPAQSLCAALGESGIRLQPSAAGCELTDGSWVAETPDGALVLASRKELVRDLLGRPEIGDRLGFSGPSVRGAAPEIKELEREAEALAGLLAAKYP
jgi:hypothetical protein